MAFYADDTLLVTAGGKDIKIYEARVPGKLIQVQRFVMEKRPDTWSRSYIEWGVRASSWLSLGDGIGLWAIPVRVRAYNKQNQGNFDGYIVYEVSRTGISRRFNVSHVASENYNDCYEDKRLSEGLLVINGSITTTKGHSILSTNVKTGSNLWKLVISNSSAVKCCSIWIKPESATWLFSIVARCG